MPYFVTAKGGRTEGLSHRHAHEHTQTTFSTVFLLFLSCFVIVVVGAQMVPSNSHCSMLVLDHVVGGLANVVAARHMFADMLFSLTSANIVGVTFADQAYLSCLGSERRCALVVHVGDTYTQVVPVVRPGNAAARLPEPLLFAAQASTHAGAYVTSVLADELRYQAELFEECTEEAYGGEKTRVIVDDIKKQCCFVSVDYMSDLQSCSQSPALEVSYALPDGAQVTFGAERFRCYEGLFNPTSAHSLPAIIKSCLDACPAQYREELMANVVLSGGVTLAQNFTERLVKELQGMGACVFNLYL